MHTTTYTSTERAPISALERAELRRNANDVVQTAVWKGFACDAHHAEIATQFAKDYFNLGCWLHYYSKRLILSNTLEDRIDCLTRLYEAGFSDPADYFTVAFGFGKQHFDALFKESDKVFEELQREARSTVSQSDIIATDS